MRTHLRLLSACTVIAAIAGVLPVAGVSSSAFASIDTTISGVVTDAVGAPLADIRVHALSPSSSAEATTIADGSYTIHGLSPDSYRVFFDDPSRVNSPEWWNKQPDYDTANPVAVVLGDAVTGIDAQLSIATISGVVTDEVGQPLAGVRVHAYGLRYDAVAMSNADGSYILSGLGADTYRLNFVAAGYSPEWWSKQPDYAGANPVVVSLGSNALGVDAALSRTTISGTVTDESGNPLSGVRVDAFGMNDSPSTTTGSDGSYTFTGVAPDTYRIEFTGAGYSPEWWSNRPDYSTGDAVTIGFGDARTGIDAQLSRASISGVVTDGSGQPRAGVQVLAYGTIYNSQATTGSDGSYTLTGLGVDTYRVGVYESNSGVTSWWNNKPDYSTADTVTVAFGDAVLGIDLTLATPPNPTAPSITLLAPSDGSSYTLGQIVTASYTCTGTGTTGTTTSTTPRASTTTTTTPVALVAVATPGTTSVPASGCVGTVPSGTAIDTSTAGTHVFTVDATDNVGNTASKLVSYTVQAGDATQTVSGGEIVSTDPGQLGASPAIPVQTRLVVPDGVAGTITVTPQPVGTSPPGFVLFGTQMALTGPTAPSAVTPYVVTFAIDVSALAGISPADVQVFRNGAAVLDCTDGSAALPDPCVAARGAVPDASGDAFITVRTTHFSAWTVGRRLIGLDGVSPSSRARGVSHQTIVMTGVGFENGASVAFAGGGLTVHSTSFIDASHLSADISISNGAALGARNAAVTNPGVNPPTATCLACFAVTPKPTISALSPNARPQGLPNQHITMTGTNFEAGAAVAISGSGVVVNSASGTGSSLALDVSVSDTAPPGARDVTVTNPDGGVVTKTGGFSVAAKPIVGAAVPGAVGQGVSATVQVLGSNFGSGGSVSFGPGISVSSVVRNSAGRLAAHVVVGPGASIGVRDVTVVNPDGGTGTCTGCLTVNPPPTIDTVAPASRPRGASHQLVTVTGAGFEVGVGASFAGGGITVHSVARNGPTSLTLDVSVSNSATTGARTLNVSNPDGGTATCAGCFTVNARPTITALTPSSRPRGGSYSVVMTGTGFQTGALALFSGGGVQVNSVTGNATSLTVNITIASNATRSNRDITITNPDTASTTKMDAFKVT